MQPSNKDKFVFSDFPPTSTNGRNRKEFSIYPVSISIYKLSINIYEYLSANIVCIIIYLIHFKYIRRFQQQAITSNKSHDQTSSTMIFLFTRSYVWILCVLICIGGECCSGRTLILGSARVHARAHTRVVVGIPCSWSISCVDERADGQGLVVNWIAAWWEVYAPNELFALST